MEELDERQACEKNKHKAFMKAHPAVAAALKDIEDKHQINQRPLNPAGMPKISQKEMDVINGELAMVRRKFPEYRTFTLDNSCAVSPPPAATTASTPVVSSAVKR